MNSIQRAIDVSIVLNLHDETSYFRRTLLSIEEAVRYAAGCGIVCELIVVLDKPTPASAKWIETYEFASFADHSVLNVQNGSLGLSRNDGIRAARGEFMLTADADDLISFNLIAAAHALAARDPGKTIWFPNYYYVFGKTFNLYRIYPLQSVTPFSLFYYHPFVSRMFCRTAQIRDMPFADLRLTGGYAFEDWHFNQNAVAQGFDLAVVPDTIIYYRRRPGSLLEQASAISNRVPPASPFFEASVYLRITAPYRSLFIEGRRPPIPSAGDVRGPFRANPVCRELNLAAAAIEPAIDLASAAHMPASTNLEGNVSPGLNYATVCELLIGSRFDDVVLAPFANIDGSEDYILDVVRGRAKLSPERRLLVVMGGRGEERDRLRCLPEGSVFLDLMALGGNPCERERQELTLRIVQTAGRDSAIHVTSSPYAMEFIRCFGSVLRNDHRIYYYRFCDAAAKHDGEWAVQGAEFDFLSECGEYFDLIIASNQTVTCQDKALLDFLSERYRMIYPYAGFDGNPAPFDRNISNRLLWVLASARQNRPSLLPIIASLLRSQCPEAVIDVFGSAAADGFDGNLCAGHANLNYRGAFSSFKMLPYASCDALIYTSAFDGLPKILLEAMAAGLTVFAPDVGGISEAVQEDWGYCLPSDIDDVRQARIYAGAISKFYSSNRDRKAMRERAARMVASRHGEASFLGRVAEVFANKLRGSDSSFAVPKNAGSSSRPH